MMKSLKPATKSIELQGALDGTKILEIIESINALNVVSGNKVLINLAAVDFMDSSGLSALIMALKHVRSKGGELYLCSLNDQCKMLLALTNMNQVFQVFSEPEEFENTMMQYY